MKTRRFFQFVVLPFYVFTAVYSGGCSESPISSTGTAAQTYQARSEKEFASNPGLRADARAVVVVQLEHLNSPVDSTNTDTGPIGEDIIPLNFTQSDSCDFRLGSGSEMKVKLVSAASGTVLYELTPSSTNASLKVPAGQYNLHLTSLKNFGTDTTGRQIVFMQQETSATDLDSARLKIFFQTGQCLHCHLENVDLSGMFLTNVTLDGSYLMNSNLSYTKLTNSSFQNCAFQNSNLSNVINANYAYFNGSQFYGSNFTRSNFTISHLKDTYLVNANFTNADLSVSDCRGANFCGATKTGMLWAGIQVDLSTRCWP